MKSFDRKFYALLIAALLLTARHAMAVEAIETPAKHAYLVDLETNTVLLDKAGDAPMAPASMTKLMTVYLVFERLKSGRLSLDDKFLVSRKAWRMGGSKMFVMVNTRVKVRDLLQGIIVQSGNDACIVIAEGLAGSEEAFAKMMNAKAHEIGLLHSSFKNATGWPAEGHYMSAHDIAMLAVKLIREFPEYYPLFSEKEFTYGGIKQGNRNPLLYKDLGADGLKTGHTEDSGYGLVASAVRKGRRLVLVVNGLKSMQDRASESARLLDWAFRETGTYKLYSKGDTVGAADVWLGDAAKVPLVINRDLKVTMDRGDRRYLSVKLRYRNPVPAPIAAGTPLAQLIVNRKGEAPLEVPLTAGKSVGRLGLFGRLNAAVEYLLWGPSAGSS